MLDAILPHLLEMIAAALTMLIAWAANTARAKWGLEIEARHRDALHSALMTGARLALDRGLSGNAAAHLAIGYAGSSVPDAMRVLKPNESVLENLARAKVAEVLK